VDLAWYYLLGDSAGKDDPASVAYRDALRWLENVARGLVQVDGGAQLPPAGGGQIKTSAPNRVFTRDNMSGF
jgi:phage gp36-like protein